LKTQSLVTNKAHKQRAGPEEQLRRREGAEARRESADGHFWRSAAKIKISGYEESWRSMAPLPFCVEPEGGAIISRFLLFPQPLFTCSCGHQKSLGPQNGRVQSLRWRKRNCAISCCRGPARI